MILIKKKNCDIKFYFLFFVFCCVYYTCYKYLICYDGFLFIIIEMILSILVLKSLWDRNLYIKRGLIFDEKNFWWFVMVWFDDFI